MPLIERQIQIQIKKLEDWTFKNGFTISKTKTVAMHFSRPGIYPTRQQPDPVLKLGDHNIEVVKETKFLGLIWDSKLSFIPHINYLKRKCMKAMNILKVLAHTDWGADQSTLLQLYRALIRSKLDYGCIVYGSARQSYLSQLDPVQNEALRLCLGAFRTSPMHSLYVEANEPPLQYRRDKLALQYGIKLKANPDNPAHEFIFPTDYTYKSCIIPSAIPAFRTRFQHLLDASNINIDDVAVNKVLYDPPAWDMPQIECLTQLTIHGKDSTPPHIYKADFNLIKSDFSNYRHIYTDGSKCGERVAYALVTRFGTISNRLPNGTSIFTAETYAVIRALEYVIASRSKQFIIFTDSLSLIQSIETLNQSNPLVVQIFEQLWNINNQEKEILFCWVPGHCGIAGNESADRAAKRALRKTVSPLSIPCTDKFPQIRNFILNMWQNQWNMQGNNKLYQIKPELGPPMVINTCRKDQVIINRVRIGHTRLTHSFLMEGTKVPPKCHFCNADQTLTVKHILLDCLYFTAIRSNYFDVSTMKDLFHKVHINNILGFLKETALYQMF